jgi:hypothetical protein
MECTGSKSSKPITHAATRTLIAIAIAIEIKPEIKSLSSCQFLSAPSSRHYTALHVTAPHCTAPPHRSRHCTVPHFTSRHVTLPALEFSPALHYSHCTTLHYTALHCDTILYYTILSALYCSAKKIMQSMQKESFRVQSALLGYEYPSLRCPTTP